MDNDNNLEQKLLNAINTHLNLCDGTETPEVCRMMETPGGREKIVQLVIAKVVQGKMDIPAAIVSIENEYNPNAY
jgi:hypothetical protein